MESTPKNIYNSKIIRALKPFVPQKIKEKLKPAIAKRVYKKPDSYIDSAYLAWQSFHDNRQEHYKEIVKELGEYKDAYSQHYLRGGFGDRPEYSRLWLMNETSLSDFRGTCIDIGCGDGFWTFCLSEWYNATGIDPVAGGIALAHAIRKRLPQTIQRRTDFIAGDALKVTEKYDVVFCKGPSFFNRPIHEPIPDEILDLDKQRLAEYWKGSFTKKEIEAKLAATPTIKRPTPWPESWQTHLEKMIAITNKMFVFVTSSREDFFGLYTGASYHHSPNDLKKLFSRYGECNIRMDSTGLFVIAEIYL